MYWSLLRTVISPMVNLMQKCFCELLYTLIFLTNRTFQVCMLQLYIFVYLYSSWHYTFLKFVNNVDTASTGFHDRHIMSPLLLLTLSCNYLFTCLFPALDFLPPWVKGSDTTHLHFPSSHHIAWHTYRSKCSLTEYSVQLTHLVSRLLRGHNILVFSVF